MKTINAITVPVSLTNTLFCKFQGCQFTAFSVMTHAKITEVDEWKVAITGLIEDNALEVVDSRMLGDVYRLNVEHPFVLHFFGGAA